MKKTGRPKGSKSKKGLFAIRDAIDQASKRLMKDGVMGMDQVIENIMERAMGTQALDEKGRVYQTLPDPVSAKVLIENRVGRAKESVEITTPDTAAPGSIPFLVIPALPKNKKKNGNNKKR